MLYYIFGYLISNLCTQYYYAVRNVTDNQRWMNNDTGMYYNKNKWVFFISLGTTYKLFLCRDISQVWTTYTKTMNVFSSPEWLNTNLFLFLFHTTHNQITQLGIEQRIHNRTDSWQHHYVVIPWYVHIATLLIVTSQCMSLVMSLSIVILQCASLARSLPIVMS